MLWLLLLYSMYLYKALSSVVFEIDANTVHTTIYDLYFCLVPFVVSVFLGYMCNVPRQVCPRPIFDHSTAVQYYL